MYNKKVSIESTVTQTTAAVVSLLEYLEKPANPRPESVSLIDMVLVLSNKKDAFYATTAISCSCPSAAYRPGQKCKHQRRYFPGAGAAGLKMAETQDSIRPTGKWPGGFNGPVDSDIGA